MSEEIKKLYRSKKDRILFGVCGGLAEYFKVDAIILRVLFVILILIDGIGVILYLILAIVVPEEGVTEKRSMKKAVEEMSEKAKNLAKKIKEKKYRSGAAKNILGAAIAAVGLIILFEEIFPMHWLSWNIIWAAFVVFIGFYIIFKNKAL